MPAPTSPPPATIHLREDVRLQRAQGNLLGHDAVLHCEGRHYALSPKLSQLARLIERHHDLPALTQHANAAWGTSLDPSALWRLIDGHLGRFVRTDGTPAQAPATATATGTASASAEVGTRAGAPELWLSLVVLPQRAVALLTPWLSPLFAPRIVAVASAAAAVCAARAYVEGFRVTRGLGVEHIFYGYAMLAGLALWHELGHATAYRRFFHTAGPVYFGFYYILPAMYVRVPDSYGGGRRDRLWVDLGGVYFQWLLFIPLYALGTLELLPRPLYLAALTTNGLMILMNVNPLLKFDGYWLLTNLLGVHNLSRVAQRALAHTLGLAREPDRTLTRLRQLRPWMVPALASFAALRSAFLAGFVAMLCLQVPDAWRVARQAAAQLWWALGALRHAPFDATLVVIALKALFRLGMLVLIGRLLMGVFWPLGRAAYRWWTSSARGAHGAFRWPRPPTQGARGASEDGRA